MVYTDRLYQSRRAKAVTIHPAAGGAAVAARMIFSDRRPMVWEDGNPTAHVLSSVAVSIRDRIVRTGSGAAFIVASIAQGVGAPEKELTLRRDNAIFEPLANPKLYRGKRAADATLTTASGANAVRVILAREESLKADYGRARRVLTATLAATVPEMPVRGNALTFSQATGTNLYKIYGVEPLYMSGEIRLILERG